MDAREKRTNFVKRYAARSGVSDEWAVLGFLQIGSAYKLALPCDCEDASCSGWQMVGPDQVPDIVARFVERAEARLTAELAEARADREKMHRRAQAAEGLLDRTRYFLKGLLAIKRDHDTRQDIMAALDAARAGSGRGFVLQYRFMMSELAAKDAAHEKALAERDALIGAAIREVWGCCEELEDEAYAKLPVVTTDHEEGFWGAQKMTAKRIRRATPMPNDATAALDRIKAEAELSGWKRGREAAAAHMDNASANCRKHFTYPPKNAEQRDWQTGALLHANAASAILALTPPADLAARIAKQAGK